MLDIADSILSADVFWVQECWVFPAFLFPNRSAAEGKGKGETKGKKYNSEK